MNEWPPRTSGTSVGGIVNGGVTRRSSALQPTPHGRLVVEVLRAELPLEVPFLSRDHDEGHHRERSDQRSHEPEAVDPDRKPELHQRERQVDRIAAETIRTR